MASLLSFALGCWAQFLLDARQGSLVPALCYLIAAGLFLSASVRRPMDGVEPKPPSAGEAAMPWAHLALAIALAALAFPRFQGNRLRPDAVLLWVGALAVLATACVKPRVLLARAVRGLGSLRGGVHLSCWALMMVGVCAVAAFLRFYRLSEIPQEMGCDVPHIYFGVQEILDGHWPIFFPSHPGREGLFFYLTAPLALVFGLSHTTIKASSALVGLATLPALYCLGRELYGKPVGLVAASLLGASHWHLIMSRRGLRPITMPLFVTLSLLWLVRAQRSGQRGAFFVAGALLGLGLYTYNAFLVVPGLIVLILIGEILVGRGKRLRHNAANLVLMALTAAIVFVPLARYAYEEPEQYFYRVATRLTGLERPIPANPARILIDNIARTLLMFNVRGDSVYAANVPDLRQLGFFTAVAFILGLSLVIWRWRRGQNLALLLSLAAMLAPSALSLAFPSEVPSATRAIGALPPVMLVAAVGLVSLGRGIAAGLMNLGQAAWGRGAATLAVTAILVMETGDVLPTYLNDFRLAQPRGNYSISLDMARTIDAFPGEAYIVVQPHWYDGNAVRAEFRRTSKDWDNEITELREGEPPLAGEKGLILVIVHPEDGAALEALRAAYPAGVAVPHYDNDSRKAFIAYYVEG